MDKLDIKLWTLASKGQIVPDRSLLKTPEQIEMIKKSAALNTAVLDHVAAHIHAGMSTAEIDKLVYDFTTEHGGIPAPLNYEGFPKSVCTSINNVICHGIPSEHEILIDGDIINVDVSTIPILLIADTAIIQPRFTSINPSFNCFFNAFSVIRQR